MTRPAKWKRISVQLESKRAYISLNRTEWDILQDFIKSHNQAEVKMQDIKELPAKVRLILFDWCNFNR